MKCKNCNGAGRVITEDSRPVDLRCPVCEGSGKVTADGSGPEPGGDAGTGT